MGGDVTIDVDQEYAMMPVSDYQIPFPVKEREIWPYLNIAGTCWYPTDTDDQATAVIEGVYIDYLVDDLLAINFKYNQFK